MGWGDTGRQIGLTSAWRLSGKSFLQKSLANNSERDQGKLKLLLLATQVLWSWVILIPGMLGSMSNVVTRTPADRKCEERYEPILPPPPIIATDASFWRTSPDFW